MKKVSGKAFQAMKITTVLTLVAGIGFHLSRLFLGIDTFRQYLFTPVTEAFFAIPMTIAAILQLYFLKKISYRNRKEKIVFYVCTIQFVLSVPLHIGAVIANSTAYIEIFPPAYSVFSVMLWIFFISVITSLKTKS
jgi:hypothetical protein